MEGTKRFWDQTEVVVASLKPVNILKATEWYTWNGYTVRYVSSILIMLFEWNRKEKNFVDLPM